jgi:hypothetical protein
MSLRTILLATYLLTSPAYAFDGWHTENVTMLPSKTAGYDYISYDAATKHLFLGHRKEGLQVFDPATHSLVATIAGTPDHSSNGITLIPGMDLGMINNEDGFTIPLKLSTLEPGTPIKLAEGIDTSHYDPSSKRVVYNVDPGKDGTDMIVLDPATLKTVGTIAVPSRKTEAAVGDGNGKFFQAGQDVDKIFVLDIGAMKLADTWSSPTCAKPTGMDVDPAGKRLFVSCRGSAKLAPALVVLNTDTGATVWSVEIGGGTDGVVYDAASRRIFTASGVGANLAVIEQTSPDSYKMSEVLGTLNNVKVLAMDHQAQKLYSMVAEGSADTSKKINTATAVYAGNTVFPNTFRVITYAKAN